MQQSHGATTRGAGKHRNREDRRVENDDSRQERRERDKEKKTERGNKVMK